MANKYTKKVKVSAWLVLIFLSGCSKVPDKKEMSILNPTAFVFQEPLDHVREAIKQGFESFQYRDMILSYKGSKFEPLDTLSIFDQNGNENDFYLRPSSSFSIGKSKLYEIDGAQLDYVATFHIHLTSVDNNQTQVNVYTIDPRVVIGKKFFPSGPHFVRQLEYLKVEPSSIEEYEILIRIGVYLGERNMPPIYYPI